MSDSAAEIDLGDGAVYRVVKASTEDAIAGPAAPGASDSELKRVHIAYAAEQFPGGGHWIQSTLYDADDIAPDHGLVLTGRVARATTFSGAMEELRGLTAAALANIVDLAKRATTLLVIVAALALTARAGQPTLADMQAEDRRAWHAAATLPAPAAADHAYRNGQAWWWAGAAADNLGTAIALSSGKAREGGLIGHGSSKARVVVPLTLAFTGAVSYLAHRHHQRHPEDRGVARGLKWAGLVRVGLGAFAVSLALR